MRPSATRASRSASEWIFGIGDDVAGSMRGEPVEKLLRPGDARAVERRARAMAMIGAPLQGRALAGGRETTARRRPAHRTPAATGRPVLDQRRDDRPVRAAREIGARAVDRIDDQEPRRRRSRVAVVLGFFRKPAEAGAATAFAQELVDRDVGFANRRIARPWSRCLTSPRKVCSASAPASRKASPQMRSAQRARFGCALTGRQWSIPPRRKVGALVP